MFISGVFFLPIYLYYLSLFISKEKMNSRWRNSSLDCHHAALWSRRLHRPLYTPSSPWTIYYILLFHYWGWSNVVSCRYPPISSILSMLISFRTVGQSKMWWRLLSQLTDPQLWSSMLATEHSKNYQTSTRAQLSQLMTDVKVEISFEYLSTRALEDNKCANDCSAARSKHIIFSLLTVPFADSSIGSLGRGGQTVSCRLRDHQWAVRICERMIRCNII